MDDKILLTVEEYRERYKCCRATLTRRLKAGVAIRFQPGGKRTKLLIYPHANPPEDPPSIDDDQTKRPRPRGPRPRWLK